MTAKLVEYLTTTHLGERGTMTLPKEYRDALKLESGAPLTILRIGDGLILMPAQQRFEQLCDSIATRLENAGITEVTLQSTLPQVREKVMRQRYPNLFTDQQTQSKETSKAKKRGKK